MFSGRVVREVISILSPHVFSTGQRAGHCTASYVEKSAVGVKSDSSIKLYREILHNKVILVSRGGMAYSKCFVDLVTTNNL